MIYRQIFHKVLRTLLNLITLQPNLSPYNAQKMSPYSLKNEYFTGNCVLLEGTGDLDHYSCVEKFNSSCPSEYYYDEDIFKC